MRSPAAAAAPGQDAAAAVRAPVGLLAPWRRLPQLAGVLTQAFAPAGARPRWLRALFAPFWLVETVVHRCAGRVMSRGPATLVLRRPQSWTRTAWQNVLLLPCTVAAFAAMLTPAAVAGAAVGGAVAGPDGSRYSMTAVLLLIAALLVWQLASLVRAAGTGVRLRRDVRVLRGPWAEVGSLAGGRDGQATRRLVRELLEWADGNGISLVAVAADERLARLYGRGGFAPLSPSSPVLVRRPRPAGSSWRPPAAKRRREGVRGGAVSAGAGAGPPRDASRVAQLVRGQARESVQVTRSAASATPGPRPKTSPRPPSVGGAV
ncbi:hypothetical protein PUR61_08410 [Streptomyces sp. BE20]|uniref:hypothetical protein n=1 Tax=Streptomyces sp. BE20 TaxID=3002525 RepID=UPI002E75B161|nr:hypothetical protein [Streptomyces sp. BE20]MEE1822217.1 hypothetical protein [Streptomyces sp. BE20]